MGTIFCVPVPYSGQHPPIPATTWVKQVRLDSLGNVVPRVFQVNVVCQDPLENQDQRYFCFLYKEAFQFRHISIRFPPNRVMLAMTGPLEFQGKRGLLDLRVPMDFQDPKGHL
ncbi:UNVERIFIED_CONTAM: hypothetical protein K2H54_046041 [Gekko kuhli]